MKSAVIHLILGAAAATFLALSYRQMVATVHALEGSRTEEAFYLPKGEGLELISVGYRNVLANVLWFNTINYFGKHFKSDRNYHWLNHMCGLVTRLNPNLSHVYEFCSLMLAWEANLPREAEKFLTEAMAFHPDRWKFPYLRGMTYLVFLKDEEKARADLIAAAKLPGVHPVVANLAAKKLSAREGGLTAKAFLADAIRSASNEWERKILLQRLREIEAAEAKQKAGQ